MNWGGFAAGLGVGINSGLKLGQAWNEASKQKKLEDIRAQGLAEATQARTAAVNGLINDTGEKQGEAVAKPIADASVEQRPLDAPAGQPAPTATAPDATATTSAEKPAEATPQHPAAAAGLPKPEGRFVVGNKRFNTREEAEAEADKRIAPITNFLNDSVLKKQQQFYVENGDVEKANQLGKYIESQKGQSAVKTFGKAITALMSGDAENGVKYLGEYYNQNVDDGVDFAGHRMTPDGKIAITLKKRDGGSSEMVLSQRELLTLGMAHDPVKLQAQLLDAQAARDKTAAEMAKEERAAKREDYRDERNFRQQKAIKSIEHQDAIERDAARAEQPGEIARKARDLKALGWDQERIDKFISTTDTKKATSPEERRALIVSDLTKNAPGFSNKTAEEQRKLVDQAMSIIYGDGQKPAAAAGLPTPQAAPNMKPMMNTKTGKIEMVPVSQ